MRKQRGNISEQLVVGAALAGVLAMFGIPRIIEYWRSAMTVEAEHQFSRIRDALVGYQTTGGRSAEDVVTKLGGKVNLEWGNAVNQITAYIPGLVLPEDAAFRYVIDLGVDESAPDGLGYCIVATGTGSDQGTILYSAVTVREGSGAKNWDGHISRIDFVTDGAETHTPAGNCTPRGNFVTFKEQKRRWKYEVTGGVVKR